MNPPRSLRALALRLGSVVALAAMAFAAPGIAAQEEDGAHPAHIHAGSCDELGDVVVPMSDVTFPEGESAGAGSAIPVKQSLNRVEMPLDKILGGEFAINIHESAEEIDVYIACGDIGGVVTPGEAGGQELRFAVRELNDSGHTGVIFVEGEGEQTEVNIMLIEPEEMSGDGAGTTPEASPAAAASAEAAAVEIKNFAFNPPTIEVPVGGSVTWTNQDNAPHTATALDRAVLQSGPITFGESYTQTFDAAGTYDYFCEFHANMKGSIVVS